MTGRTGGILLAALLVLALIGATWYRQGPPLATSPSEARQALRDAISNAAPAGPSATPAGSPTATVTQPSYLVMIVLDGARPGYFDAPNIPLLNGLRRAGTWYANMFTGILESETPSGHAALTSGSQPKQNGVLSFAWVNNNTGQNVSLFSEQAVRSGVLERAMKAGSAPTIASAVHAANPAAKVVALSGYKYYAADAFGGPDADVIMYLGNRADGTFGPKAVPGHVPPAAVLNDPATISPSRVMKFTSENRLAMTLAANTFKQLRQQVTLINLPDSDWPLGHPWGGAADSSKVGTLMRNFDRDLGMLRETYRQAGVLDKTLFVITADHGMSTITRRVPKAVIAGAVRQAGTSILRDTYHTGSYLWLKDQSRAAAAARILDARNDPRIQSIYVRQVGPTGPTYARITAAKRFLVPGMEAANQYLLNTFDGPSGPNLVVFFREGAAGAPASQLSWKGDHGGSDWNAQQVPLLLSGPGVRRQHFSNWPARLEDVAPTALSLMGIPATGMNGMVLADALRTPTAAQQAAQAATAAVLRPVIAALRTESQQEAPR